MVVSHYLVSGIQVIGLFVGTLGVFYLSEGLVGHKGNIALRRFTYGLWVGLWSAEMWVGMVVFTSAVLSREFRLSASLLASAFPTPQFLWPVLVALLGFIVGVSMPVRGLSSDNLGRGWIYSLVAILAFFVAIVALLAILLGLSIDKQEARMVAVYAFGISLPFLGAGGVLQAALLNMSAQSLQRVGLLLTLIGIATQFIPPVLDLLNIAVK